MKDLYKETYKYRPDSADRRTSELKGLWLLEKKKVYFTKWDNQKNKTMFKISDQGNNTNVYDVRQPHIRSRTPRSSIEESIIKKQNKILNDKEFKKYEDFQKNFYWNAEEGKRESGIQIITPARKSLLSKIKDTFYSSINK